MNSWIGGFGGERVENRLRQGLAISKPLPPVPAMTLQCRIESPAFISRAGEMGRMI